MIEMDIAFDRATARTFDGDGRLHVQPHAICRASVDPYFGYEIPGWQQMGLDAQRVYHMFRDPEELRKAAPTFNNLPILSEHIPVTADSHQPEYVIGSTGTDAAFDGQYLHNSTVIWKRSEINAIAADEKRHWSPAYRYRAEMKPGTFRGLHYDGIMRDIRGNHVALVKVGRQGPTVIVADSRGSFDMVLRARLLAAAGKIVALAAPSLAQDAEPLNPEAIADILAGENLATDAQPVTVDADAIAAAVVTAVKAGNLAMDADQVAKNVAAAVQAILPAPVVPPVADPAMDANAIAASASQAAVTRMNELREAERIVRPLVGEVSLSMDSAEAVYRFALEQNKVALDGVDPSAFKAMVAMLPGKTTNPALPAMDRAASLTSFAEQFPDAARFVA